MKTLLSYLCAFTLALISCESTEEPPVVDGYQISILVDSTLLLSGDTIILESKVTGGNEKEIEWSVFPNVGSISSYVYHSPTDIASDTLEVQIVGRLKINRSVADTSIIRLVRRMSPIPPRDSTICFERQILPVLNQGCALDGCHGPQSASQGYDVTKYSIIMRRVTPYEPRYSSLYGSVSDPNPGSRMPSPNRFSLTSENIEALKQWILQGAMNTQCSEEPNIDTMLVTYWRTIRPLMNNYCVGCHQPTVKSGGIDLSSYDSVRTHASSAAFMKSIYQTSGTSAMPPTIGKMSPMRIYQIEKWIREGMRK